MKTIRTLALSIAAAGVLAAGSAVGQDAKKEEPKAGTEAQHPRGEHRGHGMRGMGGMNGMSGMSGMRERCHAEPAKSGEQEHKH
jgi:hypothetical protein